MSSRPRRPPPSRASLCPENVTSRVRGRDGRRVARPEPVVSAGMGSENGRLHSPLAAVPGAALGAAALFFSRGVPLGRPNEFERISLVGPRRSLPRLGRQRRFRRALGKLSNPPLPARLLRLPRRDETPAPGATSIRSSEPAPDSSRSCASPTASGSSPARTARVLAATTPHTHVIFPVRHAVLRRRSGAIRSSRRRS